MTSGDHLYLKDTRKRAGWFWLDNEVFDMNLKASTFMVYAYLVRIADRSSEVATISLRRIEKTLGLSRPTIVNAINELIEKNMLIKKQRKSDKGNFYSNIYILTSKEDWIYPNKEVVKNFNHGGQKNLPGVVKKFNQGGQKIYPPSGYSDDVSFDFQGSYKEAEDSIKNNRNQKINKYQKSSSPYIGKSIISGDGGDEEKKEFCCEKKQGKSIDEGTKRKEKDLKDSAACGQAADPEEVLKRLKEKWEHLLKGKIFKRLSVPQVLFFLENSALPPEETLVIIKKDDENPKIENPIGTLYASLPLKSRKYMWLLKLNMNQDVEERKFEWEQIFYRKIETLKKIGIKIDNVPHPKNEQEAEKILHRMRLKLYKKFWEEMSDEERRRIEEKVKDINDSELKNEILISETLKQKGIPDIFSIYVT